MPNFKNFLNSEVIRAGAGTGKTTQLVKQVFTIYKEYKKTKLQDPKIVLTTFTRKATEELRERLFEIACEDKDYEFLSYLSSEKMLITSIDGLCFKFLSKHAESIGYPLVFSLIGEEEVQKIIKFYLSESVKKNKKYLVLLNSFSFDDLLSIVQQFYVAKLANPQLGVVNQLVLEDSYIKKSRHLLDLQKVLLMEALKNVEIDEKFYNFYQGHLDFIEHVQSLSKKDQILHLVDLLLKVKKEFPNISYSKGSGADKKIHQDIGKNIKEVREAFLTEGSSGDKALWPLNDSLHLNLECLLEEVCALFESYKKSKGKLSISDLLLLSLKIVEEKPQLAKDFSKKWDCWLIDEYQDTSFAQERLLKALVGKSRSIIVGDPQQSIYAFRGSRKEVFEAQEAQAKLANQLSYLDINYRSEASLVYFFNDFFKTFKGSFVDCFPHSKVEEKKDNIIFSSAINREEELEGIYWYIQKLKNKGVLYSDIAILARDSALLRECALFFNKKELPFYLQGAGGFFSLNEVKDLQALLRFLILPEDNLNFLHLLRSPWFVMSDQLIVDTLKELKSEDSYYKSFFTNHGGHQALQFLSSIVGEFNQSGAVYALSFFIQNSKIIDSALFYDASGRREANIWKFLVQLVQRSRVSNFNILKSESDVSGLGDLGKEGEAFPVFFSEQIEMMTIHKSKGLKFNHVILFGMDKKAKKTTDSGANKLFVVDDKQEIWASPLKNNIQGSKAHNIYSEYVMLEQSILEGEEGERLLYVALTRAAKSLYLSWVQGVNPKKEGELKALTSSSWAFICENFLSNYEWKKTQTLSVEKTGKTFSALHYNILRYFLDKKAMQENFDNLKKLNKKLNTNTKVLESVLVSSPSLSKQLSENKALQVEGNKKKLPIFTVSKIMQLLASKKDFSEPLDKQKKKKDFAGAQKIFKNKVEKAIQGTYWHSLLEHLVFLLKIKNCKAEAIKELKSVYNLSKLGVSETRLDEVLHFLFKVKEVPFSALIKKCFTEWEFQFKLSFCYVVEGKIDLWGWVGDSIWIVDYKFGSSKNPEHFFSQLELYAQAVSLKYPNNKIYLALLYPLEEKAVTKEFQKLSEEPRLRAITADSFYRAGI